MKGFVIAGTSSGSGKTTACLGILAWLSRLGFTVAPFKVGPDFIDPGHHTALTGKVSRNIDSWMLDKRTNERIFAKGCHGADIAVVEGVMGLFDGYSGTSESGSTAQMAKWLGLPVILIVDARSMARSAAAIVQGFENFDPDLSFAGVIFSKTGSERHYDYLKSAVESTCKMPCIGHLPRNDKLIMPERHLGLVTSDEHRISTETVNELIQMIDRFTDLKTIVETLPIRSVQISPHERRSQQSTTQDKGTARRAPTVSNRTVRIAVARDSAFCFYYQDNLEALEACGAELIEFSPISDTALPPEIHGIYFGGGYPELFAKALSSNRSMMAEVKAASDSGMPIYGECGGFMYLCRDITGMEGDTKWPMTGCFPFSALMSKRMRSLGYRRITLRSDTLIGKKNDVIKGHEFHYSSLENDAEALVKPLMDDGPSNNPPNHPPKGSQPMNAPGSDEMIRPIYQTQGRDGQDVTVNGYQIKNTLGSYLHAHFGSLEGAAMAFVERCNAYRSAKGNGSAKKKSVPHNENGASPWLPNP